MHRRESFSIRPASPRTHTQDDKSILRNSKIIHTEMHSHHTLMHFNLLFFTLATAKFTVLNKLYTKTQNCKYTCTKRNKNNKSAVVLICSWQTDRTRTRTGWHASLHNTTCSSPHSLATQNILGCVSYWNCEFNFLTICNKLKAITPTLQKQGHCSWQGQQRVVVVYWHCWHSSVLTVPVCLPTNKLNYAFCYIVWHRN